MSKQADSLYSVIADGKYQATSLGSDKWKTLVGSKTNLQLLCNKEGFNALGGLRHSKARIGILGNNENDCGSCDTRIGFGTGGLQDDSNTCGDLNMKAMGYILVQ